MWAEEGMNGESTRRDDWILEGIVGKRQKPRIPETVESTRVTLSRFPGTQSFNWPFSITRQDLARMESLGHQSRYKIFNLWFVLLAQCSETRHNRHQRELTDSTQQRIGADAGSHRVSFLCQGQLDTVSQKEILASCRIRSKANLILTQILLSFCIFTLYMGW